MATTPDRNEMFTALFNELHRQLEYMNTFHPSLGEIEIIVDDSPRFLDGGLSIGAKRDVMLRRATGEYVIYLDSDDWIAPNYLEVIVRMAQSNKDILTFRNLSRFDNFWMVVDMSLQTKHNEDAKPGIIFRRPWHVTAVKRVHAIQFLFLDISYGEDWTFFEKVLTLCETEEHSEAILHEYRHGKHSEADKITNYEHSKREVGND